MRLPAIGGPLGSSTEVSDRNTCTVDLLMYITGEHLKRQMKAQLSDDINTDPRSRLKAWLGETDLLGTQRHTNTTYQAVCFPKLTRSNWMSSSKMVAMHV